MQKQFDYRKEFIDSIEVVKRNKKAMARVAKNESSTFLGILTLFLSAGSSYLGATMMNTDLKQIYFIKMTIASLLLVFAGILVLHYVAVRRGGSGSFVEFFRVVSRGHILGWLGVVPFLNLLMIWQLWIIHRALMVVYHFDKKGAFSVMSWTAILFLSLSFCIQVIFLIYD